MQPFARNVQVFALILVASALSPAALAAGPCFAVAGDNITVMNLPAKKGAPHTMDAERMTGVSAMVSDGPVTNSIQVVNIKRDASKKVVSFDATIDDKAYQYPRDKCPK